MSFDDAASVYISKSHIYSIAAVYMYIYCYRTDEAAALMFVKHNATRMCRMNVSQITLPVHRE